MAAAATTQNRQRLIIELSRNGIYGLVLLLMVVTWVLRPVFFNWDADSQSLTFVLLGFLHHAVVLAQFEKFYSSKNLLTLSFLLDSVILGGLIYVAGVGQSVFIFLILVHILLAGLMLQSTGGLYVALLSGLVFSVSTLFGAELKTLNYIFLLVINNSAFLLVAGLSGYLSDQLQVAGLQLEKTGRSLMSLKQLNQIIVEHIPSGLVTFNQDGLIYSSNISANEILEDDLIGKNIFNYLKSIGPRGSATDRFDFEYKPLGAEVPKTLGLVISTIADPHLDGPLRIALIDDLTKIRKLELQIKQSEKMAAVGQLAAGIAHEIRNPLAGISGSVEMLSQTVQDEDDKKLMKIILREIDRLNNLITEFLEFSRPEKPPHQEVDLALLVGEVLDGLSMAKNVRSDIQISRVLPMKAMICGTQEKLKQALMNIIINSMQAMQDTLHPLLEVKVIEQENSTWALQVIDNGCGMSEATKKKMFEPFHTTKPKGTGLGLAITYKILENHEARIDVQSEVGIGTRFELVFKKFQQA